MFQINPEQGLHSRLGIIARPRSGVDVNGAAYSVQTSFSLPLVQFSSTAFTLAWVCRFISSGVNTLLLNVGGDLYVANRFASGQDYNVVWPSWESRSGYVPAAGERHAYAFTKSGSTGAHYLNGSLRSSVTGLMGPAPTLSTNAVTINGGSLAGIAAFAFWDRSLSALEITAWMRNPWQLFQPSRIYIPTAAAAGGVPTLSASTYVTGSLTSTGWRPQITAS